MGRHNKRSHLQQNDARDLQGGENLAGHTVISGRSIEVGCFGSMSYGSTKRSESSASKRSFDIDTLEDGGDDRDESKRKSRNLSEKKRRDQFNVLINELCSMVSISPRKMDKSTVLKATIAFLKAHNELAVQSQVQETQEDWKPSFLSNEEFTHLMLESLDGFIIVVSNGGKILYLSESITSLLGHLSSDLVNGKIYDYISSEERPDLHNILSSPIEDKGRNSVSMILNFRLGGFGISEESQKYQLVRIVGYFKRWISSDCGGESETNTEKSEGEFSESNDSSVSNYVFIATGRLIDSDLLREMSVVVDTAKNEFSSRHSLEWKFLFLDHRASPIIGYLPFEVLGTSGYDYYHVEDLEKVATCHEALMQKGEGTSCFYRFLTKGQQWIWLQTRFYITYHQWNSKPEFIVCTHRVVSYADVMKEIRGEVMLVSPRLGPSHPKQMKLEPRKSNASTTIVKGSSKQKNGNLSYGCVGSKRVSILRKLDLPPKFVSTLTTHSVLLQPHKPPSIAVSQIEAFPDSVTSICSQPLSTTVTVAIHPQMSQFVQPHIAVGPPVHQSHGTTVAVPIATFQPNSLPQNQTFAISTSAAIHGTVSSGTLLNVPPVNSLVTSSQCVLQEQLLIKHAELQRQIIQQQEELRRVSEQLLMAQCGFLPGDASIIIPQTQQAPGPHHSTEENAPNAVHLQQVQ